MTYSSTTTCPKTTQESHRNQTCRVGEYQEERRQPSKTFKTGSCPLYCSSTTYCCTAEIESGMAWLESYGEYREGLTGKMILKATFLQVYPYLAQRKRRSRPIYLMLNQTLASHIFRLFNSHGIQDCRSNISKSARMFPTTNLE